MRYRVILLLAAGLMAFSTAMKELNQLQQFALDTTHLIAQLSDKVAPNPVPQIPEIPQAAVQVETCEIKQSLPAVELPWLEHETRPSAVVPRPSQIIQAIESERPVNRSKARGVQIARIKKLPQIDVDPVAFEFKIPTDDTDGVFTSELPQVTFKAKSFRNRAIRINPRDREILLKTLNRSINLRSAS